MILPDTSVWIRHYRDSFESLTYFLENDLVVTYPVIIGELSVGALNPRAARLRALKRFCQPFDIDIDLCLDFIETHHLYGSGLSWNDVLVLLSAYKFGHQLWTFDKALDRAARHLGVAYASAH